MEKVASEIVTKMMSADLISEDEAASYRYGVQILIEKIFSYAIIFSLAIILNRFLEVLLFFISFSVIRKYSGGIHCRHFETCLVASTAVSFSGIGLFPLVEKTILTYQGGGYNVNNNCVFDWRCQQPQHRLERLRI